MVYVMLADGFEEIEALTVVDVLRRAEIDTHTVSISGEDHVNGAHDICVKADLRLDQAMLTEADMVILPGGMPGTANLEKCHTLQEALKSRVETNKWIAAICAAPSILGKKGYLKGKEAVCFPGFEKYLDGAIIRDSRVVVSGNIITSKGAGTALDFSLAIVSKLKDDKLAHTLSEKMCA